MPVALGLAECGPQKVGTARPADMNDLKGLNPCPLMSYCVSLSPSFLDAYLFELGFGYLN